MIKNTHSFKTWKTIKLGTGIKDANGFCTALKKAGCKVTDLAKDMLSKPAFTVTTEKKVELILVSITDLGFKMSATRANIYNQAKKFGLELCPAEVGPQLRLQYNRQPKYERLAIGMEPIADYDGNFRIFGVDRFDGHKRWLNGYPADGYTFSLWRVSHRWVFVRHKQPLS